jgi:hypothetical protein
VAVSSASKPGACESMRVVIGMNMSFDEEINIGNHSKFHGLLKPREKQTNKQYQRWWAA